MEEKTKKIMIALAAMRSAILSGESMTEELGEIYNQAIFSLNEIEQGKLF